MLYQIADKIASIPTDCIDSFMSSTLGHCISRDYLYSVINLSA